MKPPRFDYVAATTIDEAVSLLAEHEGEAKLLAGGQSLMPLLNMRLARPELLIDVNRIKRLDYVREVEGQLVIGATTRQRTVERSPLVERLQPLLHTATRFIAHPQIRNRGTLGGSLAHGDPAAVYPAVALALDGEMVARGPKGERRIAASDFFVTYLTTALEPTELLTELRLPPFAEGTGWSFIEVARRRGDFALAGSVVLLALDEAGCCSALRIVLFGVGSVPLRVPEAEQLLLGERPCLALFERAGEKVSQTIEEPLSDVHATAEYRRHLAGVLTRRGLTEAFARTAHERS